MSYWQYIDKEDIELDKDEINIFVESEAEGNHYVVVKVEDIKELLKTL